jgi:hypothetical protein
MRSARPCLESQNIGARCLRLHTFPPSLSKDYPELSRCLAIVRQVREALGCGGLGVTEQATDEREGVTARYQV